MFIWVGISVDEQLQEIKSKVRQVERQIGFAHSNFTLPLHISLKISFRIPDENHQAVMKDILDIYEKTTPFAISVKGTELDKTIAWIMMEQNDELNRLHDALNAMLLEKYRVSLHEYDLDYKFHTTLFMDDDAEKVSKAYQMVKETPVPSQLLANRFVIGTSETGELGSFSVVKVMEKRG